jgi:hypothetical protein
MSVIVSRAPKFSLEGIDFVSVAFVPLPDATDEHGPEDEAMYAATLAAEEWARETLAGLVDAFRADSLAAHRAWDGMPWADRATIGLYLDAIGWEPRDGDPFHRYYSLVSDAAFGVSVEFAPRRVPMTHEELLGRLLVLARAYDAEGGEFERYVADVLRDHATEAEGYGNRASFREFDARRQSMLDDLGRSCPECDSRRYEDVVL